MSRRETSESTREMAESALLKARPGSTGWYRATCPFCPMRIGKHDRRGSFGIRVADGFFHCFRCGVAGFLKQGTVDSLSRRRGRGRDEPVTQSTEATAPPPGFTLLASGPGARALSFKRPRRYLARRGVSRTFAIEAHIGAVGKRCADCRRSYKHADDCAYVARVNRPEPGSVVRNRIIVPMRGDDGAWFGWVGRVWRSGPDIMLPYYYPPGMPRASLLFNHSAITVETDEPVLVVEGVFDALPHWPNAIATLGKDYTEQQVEAMTASRRPIVVCLDGDAWEQGRALCWQLQLEGQRAAYVKLPPKTDPGDADPAWLRNEAKKALVA